MQVVGWRAVTAGGAAETLELNEENMIVYILCRL